jgi:hypothetical protein
MGVGHLSRHALRLGAGHLAGAWVAARQRAGARAARGAGSHNGSRGSFAAAPGALRPSPRSNRTRLASHPRTNRTRLASHPRTNRTRLASHPRGRTGLRPDGVSLKGMTPERRRLRADARSALLGRSASPASDGPASPASDGRPTAPASTAAAAGVVSWPGTVATPARYTDWYGVRDAACPISTGGGHTRGAEGAAERPLRAGELPARGACRDVSA